MVFKTSFDTVEDGKMEEKKTREEEGAERQRKEIESDRRMISIVSVIEAIVGIVGIALSTASYVIAHKHIGPETCFYSRVGQGIWSACVLIISGSFGVALKYRQTMFMYSVNIVISTIALLVQTPGTLFTLLQCDDRDHKSALSILYLVLVFYTLISTFFAMTHCFSTCLTVSIINDAGGIYYENVFPAVSNEEDTPKQEMKSVPYHFAPPPGSDAREQHMLSSYMLEKTSREYA